MKKYYFITGVLSALTFASFANLPSMAIQSDVSEIRAKRHADLSFDSDLKRLSDLQGRYREDLPVRKASRAAPRKVKGKAKGAVLKSPRVRAKVSQN